MASFLELRKKKVNGLFMLCRLVIRMDIVEYVEKVCKFTLYDYQKDFVRKCYDAGKNNKQLLYIPPRGNNNNNNIGTRTRTSEKGVNHV